MNRRAMLAVASCCISLVACATVGAQQSTMDKLEIKGNTARDRLVVLVDARVNSARREACLNDVVLRGTHEISARTNLVPAAGCNSEVAIFSSNAAMLLQERVKTWTVNSDDVHTVELRPLVKVPVTIWIADKDSARRARDELNHTNVLYKRNKVGVKFSPVFREVWNDPQAVDTINKGIVRTGDRRVCDVETIQRSKFYMKHKLNVYYVKTDDAGGVTGRNCAIRETPPDCKSHKELRGDGNITYLGNVRIDPVDLAHELGHAFGLRPGPCGGHTVDTSERPLPGFDSRNIMGLADPRRDHFSLGQVFRMNTHMDEWGGTMLIKNGLRPGPGRECPMKVANARCPALALDWEGHKRSSLPAPEPFAELMPSLSKHFSTPESVRASNALVAWFGCKDCQGGELLAVTHYDERVIPILGTVLKGGVSTTTREDVAAYLRGSYRDMEEQAATDPLFAVVSTEAEFVGRYVQAMDDRYRIRAAQALAAIGGANARAHLAGVLRESLSPEVRIAVHESLRDARGVAYVARPNVSEVLLPISR